MSLQVLEVLEVLEVPASFRGRAGVLVAFLTIPPVCDAILLNVLFPHLTSVELSDRLCDIVGGQPAY
jgi:hypothetical protein